MIPQDCIGFHVKWMSDADDDEQLEDLDTMDLSKVILSVHHELVVSQQQDADPMDILDLILDKVAHYLDKDGWHVMKKSQKQQRQFQVEMAKQLVQKQQLTLLEAMCILFTKEELCIYGI